jgi:hypothetical protein
VWAFEWILGLVAIVVLAVGIWLLISELAADRPPKLRPNLRLGIILTGVGLVLFGVSIVLGFQAKGG